MLVQVHSCFPRRWGGFVQDYCSHDGQAVQKIPPPHFKRLVDGANKQPRVGLLPAGPFSITASLAAEGRFHHQIYSEPAGSSASVSHIQAALPSPSFICYKSNMLAMLNSSCPSAIPVQSAATGMFPELALNYSQLYLTEYLWRGIVLYFVRRC